MTKKSENDENDEKKIVLFRSNDRPIIEQRLPSQCQNDLFWLKVDESNIFWSNIERLTDVVPITDSNADFLTFSSFVKCGRSVRNRRICSVRIGPFYVQVWNLLELSLFSIFSKLIRKRWDPSFKMFTQSKKLSSMNGKTWTLFIYPSSF